MNLWAITPYFNASHSARRRANFDTFRSRVSIPLAVAELGFDRFEIPEDAADLVMRFGDGDLMWQKERLLNLAVRRLPPDCDAVVLLDADVVFANPGWADGLGRALEKNPIAQPFSEWAYIDNLSKPPRRLFPSLVAAHPERGAMGGAWGFRREVLTDIGLYDACVVGGGDTATVNGWLPLNGFGNSVQMMPTPQRQHYTQWLERAAPLRGRVGLVEGVAYFINHAPAGVCNRYRTAERMRLLLEAQFDPVRHLQEGQDGCWRWTEAAATLPGKVAECLLRRDGKGVKNAARSRRKAAGNLRVKKPSRQKPGPRRVR